MSRRLQQEEILSSAGILAPNPLRHVKNTGKIFTNRLGELNNDIQPSLMKRQEKDKKVNIIQVSM